MTSLRRSQTNISSIAICLTGVALAITGCHDKVNNNSSGTLPDAVGGTSSAKSSKAGASSVAGGSSVSDSGGTTATSDPSAGGVTENGGESNGGTSPASGGDAPASGGSAPADGGASPSDGGAPPAEGGTSNLPVAGGGGAAGTSSASGIACESDITCTPRGLLCNKTLKQCAQCDKAADCTDSTKPYCDATGTCSATASTGCQENADCASSTSGKACDVARGRCVQCVASTDCPESNDCVNQVCVPFTTCTNSLGCTDTAAPVCNTEVTPGRCVQCTGDADCVALGAGQVCSGNRCREACGEGSTCSDGLKCNTSSAPNFCAECATHSDCAAEQYCSKGACLADVCKQGDQACVNNGIAACSTDGDGFGAPTPCGSGLTCGAANSKAVCGDGSPPVDCSKDPGKVNPCTSIPKFVGTQTVDGNGDDFCSIPSFELNFTNAAALNNNKEGTYPQKAVAKVAWSEKSFHAFIEVSGAPALSKADSGNIWDGDSIELMITTSNTVTGLTSNDSNALHVQLNDQVAATVKSSAGSGSAVAITDAAQFKGLKTSNGYIVEVNLPWPGGVSVAAETAVRFDMTMNVDLQSVDPDFPGRDAQAVLAMAPLSGDSTCDGEPTPFCDDRLWCPTQLK